jgi:hypothetical protein
MIIKINQTFFNLAQIISVTPKGMNWDVHTTDPRNPLIQLPIDVKTGHEIGTLLENLWSYTQQIARESNKGTPSPEKKGK